MFDRAAYERYDAEAKEVVSRCLVARGHIILDDTESFGVDIRTDKGAHEVEVKLGWEGEWPWAWPDVQIPYRKQRLHREEVWHWILNKDMKLARVVNSRECTGDRVRELNAGRGDGEKFFAIPLEYTYLFEIGDYGITRRYS